MKAILDISVLIASDVPPLEGELAISAVAVVELHFGVIVTSDPATRAERLRRLAEFRRRFSPLPVDDAVTTSYGRLAAAVAAAGASAAGARAMDPLIAATARAYSARLYTRNADDLVGIDHFHRYRAGMTNACRRLRPQPDPLG